MEEIENLKKENEELKEKFSKLHEELSYINYSGKITRDVEKCSVSYAYAENVVVIMCITIKPSFSGGVKEIFTISPEYAPRTITYGTYSVISASVDFGKLNFVSLNPSGMCDIWLNSRLDFHESVQFIYPLQRSMGKYMLSFVKYRKI
ncbi:MAG: hypothetical protein HFI33_13460 [Lachnospiraceae bacterium]|nr:hypothetical protein [Lachnospiraceae bacterium]